MLFGGAVATGLLEALTWRDAVVGLAVLFVVRPIAGWIGMLGGSCPPRDRLLMGFLGIRGIGTFYYVAYGLNHGDFGDSERLWAVTGFVVLVSILIHGMTSTPLMRLLDRRAEAEGSPSPATAKAAGSGELP